MSQLHRDIIKRYQAYAMAFKVVELDKNHYMFHLFARDIPIVTGTAIPIATYDQNRNVFIWSDISDTLDKVIVNDVRKLRTELNEKIEHASKSLIVMTRDEMNDMLFDMSKLLKKDILLDIAPESIHIYLVQKLLTDDR
jgi:hypothetical protein